MISRRSFLKAVFASAALTSHRLLSWADEAVEVPGKEGLIVRSARFLDLEMPPEFSDSWITPVPHFFVRNHMHEPNTLGPSEWRLTIGGEVEKPARLHRRRGGASITDFRRALWCRDGSARLRASG